MVNGQELTRGLEPRVTLLDALRNNFAITGAKRVCDRGECGACTVLMDGKTVYACTVLAIDGQGKKIETVESLDRGRSTSSRPAVIRRSTTLSSAVSAHPVSSGHQGVARQISQSHPRQARKELGRQLLPLRNLRGNSRRGRASRERREPKPCPTYKWPDAERSLGDRHTHLARRRVPTRFPAAPSTPMTSSANDLLYGMMVRSPYAHCKWSASTPALPRRCRA